MRRFFRRQRKPHQSSPVSRPVSAISGCEQSQQRKALFDHLVSFAGTSKPSVLAVLRLMISSTLVGCMTGK
jgi:hypothetical protein